MECLLLLNRERSLESHATWEYCSIIYVDDNHIADATTSVWCALHTLKHTNSQTFLLLLILWNTCNCIEVKDTKGLTPIRLVHSNSLGDKDTNERMHGMYSNTKRNHMLFMHDAEDEIIFHSMINDIDWRTSNFSNNSWRSWARSLAQNSSSTHSNTKWEQKMHYRFCSADAVDDGRCHTHKNRTQRWSCWHWRRTKTKRIKAIFNVSFFYGCQRLTPDIQLS